MAVKIFGIRHHGPGCARSLVQAFNEWKPDLLLVEGPPEAAALVPFVTHSEMEPPVAMLMYKKDQPSVAAFYPFAEYSPEWQAMRYAVENQTPFYFFDLPLAHRYAMTEADFATTPPQSADALLDKNFRGDPLALVAQAAGYADGERWWEHLIEERKDPNQLFEAILELMTALRAEVQRDSDPFEPLREAFMRKCIRQYEKDFERVAVVCGAWHAPALANRPPAKADNELLKGLPKTKVEAAWIPWTYSRLANSSGYGAGVVSPAWYDHIWNHQGQTAVHWLATAAKIFREKGRDISSAHVLEAVRLAETLAAIRNRPMAGLDELSESVIAVFCGGSVSDYQWIEENLVIGNRLGKAPANAPAPPIVQDFETELKELTLRKLHEASHHETVAHKIDLREEKKALQSVFLHRLRLINVFWGQTQTADRKAKGTFWEVWNLRWQPEFTLNLIEAGAYGNSVEAAAANQTLNTLKDCEEIETVTKLVDSVFNARLPQVVPVLMERLQTLAALSTDVVRLMAAFPKLVEQIRYGSARETDEALLLEVVHHLAVRITAGVQIACHSLDDDAAATLLEHIINVHNSFRLLNNPELTEAWNQKTLKMIDDPALHGQILGRLSRLSFENQLISETEMATRMGLALSPASGMEKAARWAQGFLQGSDALLLNYPALWYLVRDWVGGVSADHFQELLPLLRRTFADFEQPVRRRIGEMVAEKDKPNKETHAKRLSLNTERGAMVLPVLKEILGINL